MKYILMVILLFSFSAMAETVAVEVVIAPKVEAVKAPDVVALVVAEPIKTVDEVKLTVKDESFVPPEWLQNALMSVKSLPVVGPYLVILFQWLGVLVSILTGLFSFLWLVLKSLEGILGAAKLYDLANKIAMLQNSRIMYYLKAFSMFNAQKDEKPKA